MLPPKLLEQLAPTRRMVIPIGRAGRSMQLQLWTKEANGLLVHRDVMDVRFVPLIRG